MASLSLTGTMALCLLLPGQCLLMIDRCGCEPLQLLFNETRRPLLEAHISDTWYRSRMVDYAQSAYLLPSAAAPPCNVCAQSGCGAALEQDTQLLGWPQTGQLLQRHLPVRLSTTCTGSRHGRVTGGRAGILEGKALLPVRQAWCASSKQMPSLDDHAPARA